MPFKLVNVAHQANTTYPFAISLLDSMRTYDTTNAIVNSRSAIGLLATNYRKAVRDLVLEVIVARGCYVNRAVFRERSSVGTTTRSNRTSPK